jgi:hypothetical protein
VLTCVWDFQSLGVEVMVSPVNRSFSETRVTAAVDQLVEASRHFTKGLVLRESSGYRKSQIQNRWREQLASVAPQPSHQPGTRPGGWPATSAASIRRRPN